MQVHGCDPVVVGLVPAVFAAEDVVLPVAVAPGGVTAYGTPLGGIGRIDGDNGLPVLQGFVDQFLLKVRIGPGDGNVAILHPYPLGGCADVRQVFQDEERAFGVLFSKCLADAVIHITHPTVLSLTDGFEPPPGRGRPYPLQLAAERLEMRPLLLDGRAGEKGTASFIIIGDGKEPDPPVDADDVCDLGGGDHLDVSGHGDMEKEPAVFIDELRRAEAAVDVCTPGAEGHLDPSLQGVDGKEGIAFA